MLIVNLLFILSHLVLYTNEGFDEKVEILLHKRRTRECIDVQAGLLHLSLGMTILMFAIGILLVLLCLGILKGVLGLFCSSKIGMLGMNVLVDLPRPMTHYHEGELSGMDVIYDIGGWPIHPQTGERIRPLSRYIIIRILLLTYVLIFNIFSKERQNFV